MEIYPIVQVINQKTGLEFWTNIVGQTNEYQTIYSILGGRHEDTL